MTKDALLLKWQKDIADTGKVFVGSTEFQDIPWEDFFKKIGIQQIELVDATVKGLDDNTILLEGKFESSPIVCPVFKLIVIFHTEQHETGIICDLRNLGLTWIKQKCPFQFVQQLSKLDSVDVNNIVITFSSSDNSFDYRLFFADTTLDLLKSYDINLKKPSLILEEIGGKLNSLKLGATTDMLSQERNVEITIPLLPDVQWQIELFEETEYNLNFSDTLTVIGKGTQRPQLNNLLPDFVSTQFAELGISSMSIFYPYNLEGPASFNLGLYSLNKFELAPGINLALPKLDIQALVGISGPYVSVLLSGKFTLGSFAELRVAAYISTDVNEPWDLQMEACFKLNNLKLLEQLPFNLSLGELSLPGDLINIHTITLERCDILYNAGEKKILNVEFDLRSECSVKLIDGIQLQNPELSVIYSAGEEKGGFDGHFKGELKVGRTTFWGEAVKEGTNWKLSAGTGVTVPFSLKDFAQDMEGITGFGIPGELVPDLKAYYTYLQYETENKSLSFRTTLETTLELPFIPNTSAVVGSYADLNLTSDQDRYKFSAVAIATLQVGAALFSVEFDIKDNDTDKNKIFKAGWLATNDTDAISLSSIATLIGLNLDITQLPAILQPQLKEVAFSYNQADNVFALAAYTTAGNMAYLIARKDAAAGWKYAVGIDYDVTSQQSAGEVSEDLLLAAKNTGLTKFNLLYSGMDLDNFKLPQTPVLPSGKDAQLLISSKTINTKAGIFFAANVQNITLPAIGKIQPDISTLYLEVSRATGVSKALVKGEVLFALQAVENPLQLLIEGEYNSSATGGISFTGELNTQAGLQPFAQALLPDGFALPVDVTFPDVTKARMSLNTATGAFAMSFTAHPERRNIKIPDLLTAGAQSVEFERDENGYKFSLTGANLVINALTDVFPTGVSGDLKLNLTTDSSSFKFLPQGFNIVTPAIEYDQVQEVAGGGKFITTKKKIRAEAKPGDLAITRDANGWGISAAASLKICDMPYPASLLFDITDAAGQTSAKEFTGTFAANRSGVSVSVTAAELLTLEIPDILELIDTADVLPKFGKGAVRVSGITCSLGKDIDIKVDAGIALPANLNTVLNFAVPVFRTYVVADPKSFVDFQLAFGTSGIKGKLTGSMFVDSSFITNEGDDYVKIDFDKLFDRDDLGAISLRKPEVSLNSKSGSFRFRGGYRMDPVKGFNLPLFPLKRLLDALKLREIANTLPKSIRIKSVHADKLLDDLIATLKTTETCPEALIEKLDGIRTTLDKFPKRFVDYLSISIPDSLSFDIDITADGGVSFAVETAGDPLQFIIPTPLGITGYRLSRVAFGTAFGGTLLKLEISAEVDIFDYFTLAGSYLLLDNQGIAKWLPGRPDIRRTFTAKDLVILIVYETIVPIPIPLFYKALEINSLGIEGVGLVTSISFPKPEFNLMKVLSIVSQVKNFILQGTDLKVDYYPIDFTDREVTDEMNLVFSAGPFYLQLPKYMGEETESEPRRIGIQQRYRLIDVLNTTAILLNGMKYLIKDGSPAYLIKAFPIAYRKGQITARLMDVFDLQFKYLISTPAELIQITHDNPEIFLDQPAAKAMLGRMQFGEPVIVVKEGDADDKRPVVQSVAESDNGMAVFLAGSFTIGSKAAFKAEAAMLHAGKSFGVCYNISGFVNHDVLLMEMNGLVVIRNQTFATEGAGLFKLYGIELFKGYFVVQNEYFKAEATGPTGIPGLPFEFYGKLEGRFSKEKITLDGNTKFRLFGLQLNADTSILIDGAAGANSHFNFNGSIQYQSGSYIHLDFLTQLENTDRRMQVNFEALFVDVLGLYFQGKGYVNLSEFYFASTAKVTLLGKQILSADVEASNEEIKVRGDFEFFPGFSFQGAAIVNRDSFNLVADGVIGLGPFRCSTRFTTFVNNTTALFSLSVSSFLIEQPIAFILTSKADNKLQLQADIPAPLVTMFGMVTISSQQEGSAVPAGPQMLLKLSDNALEELYFNAKVSFLGFASDSVLFRLNSEGLTFSFLRDWNIGDVLSSRMSLSCVLKPLFFNVTTSASFELDFMPVLSWLFPNSTPKDDSLSIKITLQRLSLTIERDVTPEQRKNQELRNYEQNLRQLLANAAEEARAMDRQVDNQIANLRRTIEQVRASYLPEQTINDHCNNMQVIIDSLEFSNGQFNDFSIAGAKLQAIVDDFEAKYNSTSEDIDYYLHYAKGLRDAAEDWYYNHWWDKTHNGYGDALEKLKEHAQKLYNTFTQKTADETLHEMQHNLYWSWFAASSKDWYRGKSEEADSNMKMMYNQLHDDVGMLAYHAKKRVDRNNADIEDVKAAISRNMVAADGRILLALADCRAGANGKLKGEELLNRPIGAHSRRLTETNELTDHLTVEAILNFSIAGYEFNLANLRWVMEAGVDESNIDIMSRLPDMIKSYLIENFAYILVSKIGSLPATIKVIHNLIFAPGSRKRHDGGSSDIEALRSLSGLDGTSLELAAKAGDIEV